MSTFTTERLKELVTNVIKGAGFDKLFELSTYLGIKVKDGTLYLNTTDGTTYMRVTEKCEADDFDIVVDAELFSRLIGRINSTTVDLEIVDNTLVIKGNGKYTLELVPDVEGNLLSFPDKFPTNVVEITTLGAFDLAKISSSLKASLSTVAGTVYNSYYFGDVVASTDKITATIFNKRVFDTPYLFNRNLIDLVMVYNDVTVSKSDDMLVLDVAIDENANISVCTKIDTGVSEFNIEGVRKFSALDVNSFCRFKKAQMLDLLDRLSLFVSKFDDGCISLHFTDSQIEVSSMAKSGIECVDYTESKNTQDMTIKINIDRLRNQLKAYGSDIVDLYYGSDVCIKLVDGDITQVIALIR